ncbi:hypothetical protein H6G36_12065 [Anabaena minutissima FACHB-250]|nr:hypothetical protein [Anabaena minutissima FACHB-250]
MLNNISNFFSLRQLTIPAIGLIFTLGVVGEKTLLNNQIKQSPHSTQAISRTGYAYAATLPTSTQKKQDSSSTPLLVQLRQIREQRSQLPTVAKDTESISNLQSQQPRLVSSISLEKNINTQKAAKNSGISQKVNVPTKDGIYLYGQSAQPNQIGQGYVVFQKRQGRLVGALYMPRSEFSCFQGTLNQSGELAMTVTSTPDAGISPDVATTSRIPRFSSDEPMTYAHSVALQDYHQINSISGDDRRILQMCTQR